MQRSTETEFMDRPDLPTGVAIRGYRELTRIQRLLGNTGAMISALRRDPLPVRRVLDVGCATGGVLLEIGRKLNVDVIGVDIRPARSADTPVPIVQADAVRDPLPAADVAISMCMAHHLSEDELARMIRNVGRSCRRFIVLDLVRHRMPLALFRAFAVPFFTGFVVEDGLISIRRAYTPFELRRVVTEALRGTGARFRHAVAPLYTRQIVDISWSGPYPATPPRNIQERIMIPVQPCRASFSSNVPMGPQRPCR